MSTANTRSSDNCLALMISAASAEHMSVLIDTDHVVLVLCRASQQQRSRGRSRCTALFCIAVPNMCMLCAFFAGAAAELALTARNVPGSEASSLGLVSRCYDSQSDMMHAVTSLAQQMADKSPLAVTGTKQILLHTRWEVQHVLVCRHKTPCNNSRCPALTPLCCPYQGM